MILVVFLYALLALTFIIAKCALYYADPCFLIGIRMVLAGSILCIYHIFSKQRPYTVLRKDWWLFFQAALFHIFLAFVLEFMALQDMSPTKVNMLYATTPFISAVLAYILHAEKMSLRKIAGIFLGLVSILPVLHATGAQSAYWGVPTHSELLLIGAIICSAYGWFVVRKLMDLGYSLALINGVAMFAGGLGALLTSICIEPRSYTALWCYPFWIWLSVLVLTANIVVYNLYGWLCKRYSITFISSAGFLCPLFGGLFGWLLDDEKLTWHYCVSFIGIAAALWIYYKELAFMKE